MPTATVQVRQTTTTTTARSSVIVINTGYLSSKLGLLKFLITVLSLVTFIMVLMSLDTKETRFFDSDRYLLMTSFADWITVTLMLISALLSLGSATILPKASFDFIFHFILGLCVLAGGIWVAVDVYGQDPYRNEYIQAACICAMICGLLQIIHGIFSYRLCVTN